MIGRIIDENIERYYIMVIHYSEYYNNCKIDDTSKYLRIWIIHVVEEI